MLKVERILKQDRLVRATTGLNIKALKALEPSFKAAYEQSLIKPEKERKRQQGGGRKPTLRTSHQLQQTLVSPLPQQSAFTLNFLSPTSFRQKHHHLPLPIPTNIFHSYLRRWNNFAPEAFPQEKFLQ